MRDKTIDFLRGMSIFGIILIHVLDIYEELLNHYLHVVVITLVFCSGASFYYSYNKKQPTLIKQIFKRLKRLYIPWWIFISLVYFPLTFAFDKLSGNAFRYGWEYIIRSYVVFGMRGGLPYGWILYLTLILSLYALVLYWVHKHLSLHSMITVLLVITAITQHFSSWIYTLLPFGYITAFVQGMAYGNKQKIEFKYIILYCSVLLSIVIFYLIIAQPITFTSTKLTPDLFFVASGLLFTMLIAQLLQHLEKLQSLFNFFSTHSLWIYLWHIQFMGITDFILRNIGIDYFILRLFMVVTMSIGAVYAQQLASKIVALLRTY